MNPSTMDNGDLSDYDDEDDHSTLGDDATVDSNSKGSVKVAREDIKLMNVVRAIVILIMLTFAFIAGSTVYVITNIAQGNNFQRGYYQASTQIIEHFYAEVNQRLLVAQSLAMEISTTTSNWPFVTVPSFPTRCVGPMRLAQASSISLSPLVEPSKMAPYLDYTNSAYSTINQGPLGSDSGVAFYPTKRNVSQGVYRFQNGTAETIKQNTTSQLFPIWQMTPSFTNATSGLTGTLFHQRSNVVRGVALETVLARNGSAMTSFLYGDTNRTDFANYATPRVGLYYPIYGLNDSVHEVVGVINMEMDWTTLFDGALDARFTKPLQLVVENGCGGAYSFTISAQHSNFTSKGIKQDNVDDYKVKGSTYAAFAALFDIHGNVPLNASGGCNYKVTVYATASFKSQYMGNRPEIYRSIVLAVFFALVGVFLCYDTLIERRQSRVVGAAERSDAIVRSLFPAKVRDRLYEQAMQKEEARKEKEKWQTQQAKGGLGAMIMTPKHRLKKFIHEDSNCDIEPIADLFPNCTVLFADISGFTAWSSEREPSQVFTLLETIYRFMDKAAKKLDVFKVETVGDCYVAATGVPDPQENHAELMIKFAKTCLMKVSKLTAELEAQLGPGTGDLAMRFGIHSGSVTAGVLRGQKARFQLFGDTMNTASRMESTGFKNKIHVSMETAQILMKKGMGHMVIPRSDKVIAKGKGELQTYWVSMGSSTCSSGSSGYSSNSSQFGSGAKFTLEGTGLENVLGVSKIDSSIRRLVDWNTEVLSLFLNVVVSHRAATDAPSPHISPDLEMKMGGKRPLDDIRLIIRLPEFNPEVAEEASKRPLEYSPDVVNELRDYVAAIASGYRKNPFHNFEHASHVMLSANKLLKRIMAADDAGAGRGKDQALTSRDLYEHTYGIGTDPLTHFTVVFAALIHDVGHCGVANGQLCEEDPELGSKYSRRCVAEQRSIDIAWNLLLLPHFSKLRAAIYRNDEECERFRCLLVNSVMATDIFDKELKELRTTRWDAAFHAEEEDDGLERDRKATIVIDHIIQASDVAHTMQHWHIYLKWNERLFIEMYFAFLQGRSQKEPSEGWYNGELWFFDNYVIPLARKLKECGVFGVSGDEYLDFALQNRSEWERKGTELVEGMKQRARLEADAKNIRTMDAIGEEASSNHFYHDRSEITAERDVSENPLDNHRIVIAPPGKLGIVIETNDDCALLESISPDSPLVNQLTVGDRIIAINGVPTKNMSASSVALLISVGADQPRILTLAELSPV